MIKNIKDQKLTAIILDKDQRELCEFTFSPSETSFAELEEEIEPNGSI